MDGKYSLNSFMYRAVFLVSNTGAVTFKKGCFWRKTKCFWESEDFAMNWDIWEIFQTQVNISGIVLDFLGSVSQKFGMMFQKFEQKYFIYTSLCSNSIC